MGIPSSLIISNTNVENIVGYICLYLDEDITTTEFMNEIPFLADWFSDPDNKPSPFDNDGTFKYTKFITDKTTTDFIQEITPLSNWFTKPDEFPSPFVNKPILDPVDKLIVQANVNHLDGIQSIYNFTKIVGNLTTLISKLPKGVTDETIDCLNQSSKELLSVIEILNSSFENNPEETFLELSKYFMFFRSLPNYTNILNIRYSYRTVGDRILSSLKEFINFMYLLVENGYNKERKSINRKCFKNERVTRF